MMLGALVLAAGSAAASCPAGQSPCLSHPTRCCGARWPSGPTAAELTLDLGGAGTPFPHYWKRCFGSGHAYLGTRADWQQHLQLAVNELGVQGVRMHGVLDGKSLGLPLGFSLLKPLPAQMTWASPPPRRALHFGVIST